MPYRKKEIFVKQDRCMGCHSCIMACAVEHSQTGDLFKAIFEKPLPRARIYVETLSPDQQIPLVCRQCEDAPCMYACISGAITRNLDGNLLMDQSRCIGCWTCVMVCPYGVIGRNPATGKAYRCDRCPDKDIPVCVSACPTGALIFETVENYAGNVRKKVSQELARTERE